MRDEKRIDVILNEIGRVWHKYPDQRLGQLLSNYVFGHHTDIFFQEDDTTLENLKGA